MFLLAAGIPLTEVTGEAADKVQAAPLSSIADDSGEDAVPDTDTGTGNSASPYIKGKVLDASTGDEITGAAIILKDNPEKWAVSGLDGSFSMQLESDTEHVILCSLIGYKDTELSYSPAGEPMVIRLQPDTIMLDGATVSAENKGKTEAGARAIEKTSLSVMNVMSARAIELSPDLTVANAIQRMSGVTVERNSSGEGQYAILRGMDKRYNYTLVNGVKIPSPDNKNRFVPLDIFPSEMLDRLEVTKALTADMEGDGIGGAVNLVMKDAPERMEVNANLATGYNALYFNRDFESFSHRAGQKMSPYERMGRPEDYAVTMDDFTTENMHLRSARPRPDVIGGFSFGDRYFNNRLGLMLAVSYQNLFRGKDTDLYYVSGSSGNGTENRTYSEEQSRLGAHAKLDYRFNGRHKLMLYAGYMDLRESEVRNGQNRKDWIVKMQWNRQYIINTTLKGEHSFLEKNRLKLDWTGVFSKAYSTSPDNSKIYINMQQPHLYNTDSAEKRWEHNSDRDFAFYANLSYDFSFGLEHSLLLKAGGMYRNKIRDSFFNEYTFDSATGREDLQYYGSDWTNFDQLLLTPRAYGNIGDPLNYDAWENIAAGYFMARYNWKGLEVIAGVRAEHTDQGYTLDFPRKTESEGDQNYTDILPSVHLKYNVHKNANLRFSYGRSINRPGFFEIVPYTVLNEDYDEKGNPELQHTVADNLDLRYEFFPKSSEQFMVGLFWKNLQNPIEYGLINEGQATYISPMNFGNAMNAGVEIDIMKYFKWFGIKANYTWTKSSITTNKRLREGTEVVTVTQTRPLYGQAAHVANLSLLFNFPKCGIEAQVSGSYTGKRLSEISNWLDNDIWEAGYMQLDASIEKTFKAGFSIFAKASNLLDTPVLRYIMPNRMTESLTDYERYKGGVIERREWHAQTVTIGVRYRFSEK